MADKKQNAVRVVVMEDGAEGEASRYVLDITEQTYTGDRAKDRRMLMRLLGRHVDMMLDNADVNYLSLERGSWGE